MQISSVFEGFPFNSAQCIVWVGNIMTPVGHQKNDAHLSSEPQFSNLKRACKLISDI